jgi:hypothetical protein
VHHHDAEAGFIPFQKKYNIYFSELHHKKIILLAVFFTEYKSAMQ